MRQMLSRMTVAFGKFIEAEKLQGKHIGIYLHTHYLNLTKLRNTEQAKPKR